MCHKNKLKKTQKNSIITKKGGHMIYILILLGFALLIYGGNILVDGSVAIAKHLKVSPLLIGYVLLLALW